ncbi:MAG: Panacea domain-containing protein [Sulfolobales archaeon]
MGREHVLLYLLSGLFDKYGEVYGRKKIQKLLFLVEHYDLEGSRVVRSQGLTGYRFIVWLYGPFSKDVYDDLDVLVERGLIEEKILGSDSIPQVHGIRLSMYDDDGYPKTLYIYRPRNPPKRYRLNIQIAGDLARKIDQVVQLYGGMSPTELEEHVNNLLKLTPEKKIQYWGRTVDEYLQAEGLA